MVALLQEGIDRGELRSDIDIDSCIDLINGVFYYQLVVRGVTFDHPEVVQRCREAITVAWRGTSAEPREPQPR